MPKLSSRQKSRLAKIKALKINESVIMARPRRRVDFRFAHAYTTQRQVRLFKVRPHKKGMKITRIV